MVTATALRFSQYIFVISPFILFGYSGGPPSGYANNAPYFQNCTACHSGTANSASGSVSFIGLPDYYTSGETYSIGVVVSGVNDRGYGFQAIAMADNDVAGSINLNANSDSTEINGNYVQQSARTTSGSWIFDWIAPSTNVGDVTFTASGLATGGSSSTGGDDVYTIEITVPYQQLAVQEDIEDINFLLYSNYPNPFNPVTTLRYNLMEDSIVKITIYDVLGNTVNNIFNGIESSGYKTVQWDATNNQGQPVSSGVYLYTIESGDYKKTSKVIFSK
tara:strand:+ start:1645 stop:2472 length:828 start_codon:yes stop_codon:yes gene_type:complete